MKLSILTPSQALNKAFLKLKPHRLEIENFTANLAQLRARINNLESEEFHKHLLIDFLKKSFYDPNYFINTKGRNDLVIHNGNNANSTVGVIIEVKKPANKAEMISPDKINAKALQELVLYYLRERITQKNLEIKYLIATNIYEWFIFDAMLFDRLFAQDKNFVMQFNDFETGRLAEIKTDFFYTQVASPFIATLVPEIEGTYFDIRDQDDTQLIALCKLFSPVHLLKLPFANDSNSLDKRFYSELLHIIGLIEIKDGSKKLIERNKPGQRNTGSLLENAILQLDSLDKISRLEHPLQFGTNVPEQLFNLALELSITWINRILFLKLLEAQLVTYHQGDTAYEFLNFAKIKTYDDLNHLFFQVLARRQDERHAQAQVKFSTVPYLNSSLFEPTAIEHATLFINQLRHDNPLPIFAFTVLKDVAGNKRSGNINPLQYLFEFLSAYNFASDSNQLMQEDNKTLINAAVLGLIFEKINGYKDGSFFTPGFITMYMCRETIRAAVIQKFNAIKGWKCTDINSLYNAIEDRNEANEIINSLRICDPAVGSGHFLVSALNEMLAIKSDLNILQDRAGRRLKEYHCEVVNDELMVTDENGALFEYNPLNRESQRVQEALFHEKQLLIENCLFGVDINPNSVKICRLRLWIELLKHAYYKNETELETLPNIDINIKGGNSLISRFALDVDLKQALINSAGQWTIESYRLAVATYRNAHSKEQKREMERLIGEIKTNFRTEISQHDPKVKRLSGLRGEVLSLRNQSQLFELSKKDIIERDKRIAKLLIEIEKLEVEIEAIRSNKIYENALEWRFEFPEVLNSDGDFVGFDVVIGNPPYIRQEEFSAIKPYLKSRFEIYHSIADLLTYFVELSYKLLKPQGSFQFIISNKFTRANYGQVMRQYLLHNTRLTHFLDFSGVAVFDEATVDAAIIGFEKRTANQNSFIYANISKQTLDMQQFDSCLNAIKTNFQQQHLTGNAWAFESLQVLAIKHKVEAQGIPLQDWNISIYRGVLTGFNDAFVIDGKKKAELIATDPASVEIIKPLLRGRDIQKWYADYQDLWLIYIPWHFPLHNDPNIQGASKVAEDEFSKNYPAIYNHLSGFKSKLSQRNSAETGIRYEWYALQRFGSNYWQDFKKPKLIWKRVGSILRFCYEESEICCLDSTCIATGEKVKFLAAVLNSKLCNMELFRTSPKTGTGDLIISVQALKPLCVPIPNAIQEELICGTMDKIIEIKRQKLNSDTSDLESTIDQLVYQLYDLTPEEIAIIESSYEL